MAVARVLRLNSARQEHAQGIWCSRPATVVAIQMRQETDVDGPTRSMCRRAAGLTGTSNDIGGQLWDTQMVMDQVRAWVRAWARNSVRQDHPQEILSSHSITEVARRSLMVMVFLMKACRNRAVVSVGTIEHVLQQF